MNALLRILIESTIILSGFYAIYLVFFSYDKDFKFTRVYLIVSSFLAILIPQLNLPILSGGEATGLTPIWLHNAVQLPEIIISDSGRGVVSSGIQLTPSTIFLMIYLAGFIFFLFKFLIEIFRLLEIIYRNSNIMIRRPFYKMIYTGGRIPTSSFFNYLFWDETTQLNEEEKNQIIRHEEGHISQLHSIDIMYIELLRIVFWFNPFIHSYRKAIATVHEYLADEYVLKKKMGHRYLNLLARQVLASCNLSINNHFSKSRTLKRIRMIQSNQRKPAILRWGLSLSMLALMFYLFACDMNGSDAKINMAAKQKPINEKVSLNITKQDKSNTYRKTIEEWNKNNPENDFQKTEEKENQGGGSFAVADIQPVPQGGLENFYLYIMENLKYPEEAKKDGKEGIVFVEFTIRKNGTVDQVKTIKGFDESCNEEALRVIRQSPKWIPGYKDEKAVDVKLVLPITFKLDQEDHFKVIEE